MRSLARYTPFNEDYRCQTTTPGGYPPEVSPGVPPQIPDLGPPPPARGPEDVSRGSSPGGVQVSSKSLYSGWFLYRRYTVKTIDFDRNQYLTILLYGYPPYIPYIPYIYHPYTTIYRVLRCPGGLGRCAQVSRIGELLNTVLGVHPGPPRAGGPGDPPPIGSYRDPRIQGSEVYRGIMEDYRGL